MIKKLNILFLLIFSLLIFPLTATNNPQYYNTLYEGETLDNIIINIHNDYVEYTENFTIHKGSAFYIESSNGVNYYFGDELFFTQNGYSREDTNLLGVFRQLGDDTLNIALNLENINSHWINNGAYTELEINQYLKNTFIHEIGHKIDLINFKSNTDLNILFNLNFTLQGDFNNPQYFIDLAINSNYTGDLNFIELQSITFSNIFLLYDNDSYVNEIKARLINLCYGYDFNSTLDTDYRQVMSPNNYTICNNEFFNNSTIDDSLLIELNNKISYFIEGYIDYMKYPLDRPINNMLADMGGGIGGFFDKLSYPLVFFLISLAIISSVTLLIINISSKIR